MYKFTKHNLSAIAYILAFLVGVLLLFLLGIKPEPVRIAGLMGLSVSAIMFSVWSKMHNKNKVNDSNDSNG